MSGPIPRVQDPHTELGLPGKVCKASEDAGAAELGKTAEEIGAGEEQSEEQERSRRGAGDGAE